MAFSALGTVDVAALLDEAAPADFESFCRQATARRIVLVEIYAFQPGSGQADGITPLATLPLGSLPDGEESFSNVAGLFFSDAGFLTEPDDAPANTFFDPRAIVPLSIDRTLPLGPEQPRRLGVHIGAIELDNHDGALDSVVDTYAVDGRKVVVKIGSDSMRYADFVTVFNGSATYWQAESGVVRIGLRDNGYKLEVPLQTTLYAGSGGAEGTSELADKPKPVGFGPCPNVTPVLVDPPNLVYQVNWRRIQAVGAVYIRGAAQTGVGDHASYAALIAAPLSGGQYATCLAEGLIRLGASPDGLVTCDFRGDAPTSSASGGGYVETAPAIARRILMDYVGVAASAMRGEVFDGLAIAQPAAVGWYRGADPILAADTMDLVLHPIGAHWGCDRAGLFTCGRLTEANEDSPDLTIDESDILDFDRQAPPDTLYPPSYRRTVGYQKNWTVQRGEDLAASVTDARRQFLAEPLRLAAFEDGTVQLEHLLAQDPPAVSSLEGAAAFDESYDALDEAERLQDLLGTERNLYQASCALQGLQAELGYTCKVTYPRYGFSAGRFARVVGIREDLDRAETTLVLLA